MFAVNFNIHNIELWNFTGGDLEEHFGYKMADNFNAEQLLKKTKEEEDFMAKNVS